VTAPITWEPYDVPVDEGPEYGPACPGPQTHRWTLTIDGGDTGIGSGCSDCDAWMETHMFAVDVTGTLTFEHEHQGAPCPNANRFLPCDCNYWWRFTPSGVTP
jgi:hypothetical protein